MFSLFVFLTLEKSCRKMMGDEILSVLRIDLKMILASMTSEAG